MRGEGRAPKRPDAPTGISVPKRQQLPIKPNSLPPHACCSNADNTAVNPAWVGAVLAEVRSLAEFCKAALQR